MGERVTRDTMRASSSSAAMWGLLVGAANVAIGAWLGVSTSPGWVAIGYGAHALSTWLSIKLMDAQDEHELAKARVSSIKSSHVISEPGAGITVTEYELTDEAKIALCTNGAELTKVK